MWAKVQEVIEDIRPLVESVGCHMELVDVLNGEVTIRLTPSEFAVQHNPKRLQEFIEREVMGELPDIKRVTVESKAPPPPKAPEPKPVQIDVVEPPEDTDTAILTLDRVVKEDGSAIFDSAADAAEVPVVQDLFRVEGVASVMVKDRMIIVGRSGEEHPWPALISQLRDAITAHYAGAGKTSSLDDQTLRERVQDILDREINPAVAAHGGTIDLVDVKSGVVHLHMGGGCQGCGMASVTLSQGVRRAIFAAVPEVVDIVDNTDHTAGTNPYYQP